MCEFNKEDVLALARAIMEDNIEYIENMNCLGPVKEYFCDYCGSDGFKKEDIKHKVNCLVLIAQDILTGTNI